MTIFRRLDILAGLYPAPRLFFQDTVGCRGLPEANGRKRRGNRYIGRHNVNRETGDDGISGRFRLLFKIFETNQAVYFIIAYLSFKLKLAARFELQSPPTTTMDWFKFVSKVACEMSVYDAYVRWGSSMDDELHVYLISNFHEVSPSIVSKDWIIY